MFDAITRSRAYQRAQSFDDAIDVLRRQVELGWRRDDPIEEFIAIRQGRAAPGHIRYPGRPHGVAGRAN